jgi:hypothetical protein
MNMITTKDTTKIYFKDWGTGRPVVFSQGWPLGVPGWFAKGLTALWRGAHLGPIVTFAAGIFVGLLIPSADWPAIVTVIVTGALLQRIVSDR